jgi:phospholipid/cholesterol/gamma-HCH transport system substrate-binding protein
MRDYRPAFKIRLGIFIVAGFVLFLAGIFFIGRQKNLFNPVFRLDAVFRNVGGLQVGNNVRFSGINLGTIDNINIINDSTVLVSMTIKRDVKKFIKTDSKATIASEGIIGDRILNISQGQAGEVSEGQRIAADEPVDINSILTSLSVTAQNAEVITYSLAEILAKIDSGSGALGMLIGDSSTAENLSKTILNLRNSSKNLNENMEAAKHNFLLRGFFKKKQKEEEKKREEIRLKEEKNKTK